MYCVVAGSGLGGSDLRWKFQNKHSIFVKKNSKILIYILILVEVHRKRKTKKVKAGNHYFDWFQLKYIERKKNQKKSKLVIITLIGFS